MDFETYKSSLTQEAPPEGLSMAAQALWWEAKGDWHRAHQCAQNQADAEGADFGTIRHHPIPIPTKTPLYSNRKPKIAG